MLGRFATRHAVSIVFVSIALCCAGIYAALTLSSSVFSQTDFPRVVILADNGVMPADEMMASITRPIEEAMKDIPGVVTVRSATGRGAAEINVFFTWHVDMVRSELFVLSRLAQIRSRLPASADTTVFRLTFAAFPILGVSLTSSTRDITDLWEKARYDLKLRFLQIPGVVDIFDGLVYTGPTISLRPRPAESSRFGLTTETIANATSVAMLGESASARIPRSRPGPSSTAGSTSSSSTPSKTLCWCC
jgi:multidrug efflux pump subunit AcrB